MIKGSLDKIKRSVIAKVAGLFALALIAITFLAFPFNASAVGGINTTATFKGFLQSCGEPVGPTWGESPLLAITLVTGQKVSSLKPGTFIQVIFRGKVENAFYNGENKATLSIGGKAIIVTLK